MKITDRELDRQDNGLAIGNSPEEVDQFKFGFWPEIIGLIAVGVVVWIMQL